MAYFQLCEEGEYQFVDRSRNMQCKIRSLDVNILHLTNMETVASIVAKFQDERKNK